MSDLIKNYLQEFVEFLLNEEITGHKANRAAFIKQRLEPHWKGLPGYPELDKFLEKIAEVDPSLKGIYMLWMATLCLKKPQENKTEDLDRVGADLSNFEKVKAKLAIKDINGYKSFYELFGAVDPLVNKPKSKEDIAAEKKDAAKQAALNRVKGEITTVYNGPEGWIRIPTTLEAAKFLGQNTRWCTAADKNNYFDHYNKSDVLFVVYDKASKDRFQLHIDSGQFADVTDKSLGMNAVPEWSWKPITDWYKANNKNLTIKHLMTLGKHSDENLAANTPHAGLLDLMKQYDVG